MKVGGVATKGVRARFRHDANVVPVGAAVGGTHGASLRRGQTRTGAKAAGSM